MTEEELIGTLEIRSDSKDQNMKQFFSMKLQSKKGIACSCFLFFVLLECFLIWHYEGWYAFDETYHISSSNPEFYQSSLYFRAPYINGSIRLLSAVLGQSYFVYKLIPLFFSMISAVCLLYVVYQMTEHRYSILCFTFVFCFQNVLMYNHLYIRQYVVYEAFLSSFAFVFCRLSRETVRSKRVLLYLLYVTAALGITVAESFYSLSRMLTFFALFALLANEILKRIVPRIKGKRYFIILLAGIGVLLLLAELVLVMCKKGAWDISFINAYLDRENYPYLDHPYFTRHFYREGIGIVAGVALFSWQLLHRDTYEDNRIGIWCLGVVPFLVFNMTYYDCFPMRIYAAYYPVFILLGVLGFDGLNKRILSAAGAVCSAILIVAESQPDVKWSEYIRVPYIINETNFNDYGSLVSAADDAIESGRKCICIWSNDHQKAAFVLDAEETIGIDDSINQLNGYTREYFMDMLERMQTTEEPYVLLVGTHCDITLDEIVPEFLETLRDTYPYEEYERKAYLFYIN